MTKIDTVFAIPGHFFRTGQHIVFCAYSRETFFAKCRLRIMKFDIVGKNCIQYAEK